MLVERTNLQLKGAFAENIDGQTPLDVCQEPFHSKLIALTKEHTFTAFLSHYKMETAAHARILKDHLEQSFGRGRVFLDSDDLRNLSELLHCVAASDVMVVLLSPGVLTRPWCLMELITAMERGKPIVPISCENLPQGMYDHKEMTSFLSSLEANLNACNPGATDLLRQNGVENMDVSGQALLPYIHEPIAKPFRVDWSQYDGGGHEGHPRGNREGQAAHRRVGQAAFGQGSEQVGRRQARQYLTRAEQQQRHRLVAHRQIQG